MVRCLLSEGCWRFPTSKKLPRDRSERGNHANWKSSILTLGQHTISFTYRKWECDFRAGAKQQKWSVPCPIDVITTLTSTCHFSYVKNGKLLGVQLCVGRFSQKLRLYSLKVITYLWFKVLSIANHYFFSISLVIIGYHPEKTMRRVPLGTVTASPTMFSLNASIAYNTDPIKCRA